MTCSHELQSFHQFSGQCWSDSAANLLFFAAGVGAKVQDALQDSALVERLDSWLREKDTFDNISFMHREDTGNELSHYTDDEYYNIFIPALKDYVRCLQLRYLNMIQAAGTPATRRRASCVYSLCKEETGALAAEVLTPKEQRFGSLGKAARRSLERRMEEASRLPVNLETLAKHPLVGKEEKGYSNLRFGKVIGILLDFFTGGKVFQAMNAGVLATGPFKGKPLAFTVKTRINEISRALDDSYYISSVATVKEVEGSHAITFLTCENGHEFIYDDNRSVLKEIPWTAMFGTDEEKVYYVSKYDDDMTYGKFIEHLKASQKTVKDAYRDGEIDDEQLETGDFYDKAVRKLKVEIPNIKALMAIDFGGGAASSPVLKFIFDKKPTMVLFTKEGDKMKLLTQGKITNVNLVGGKDRLFREIYDAYDGDFKMMCFARITTNIFWLQLLAYTVFKKVGRGSKSKSKSGTRKTL